MAYEELYSEIEPLSFCVSLLHDSVVKFSVPIECLIGLRKDREALWPLHHEGHAYEVHHNGHVATAVRLEVVVHHFTDCLALSSRVSGLSVHGNWNR